MAIMNILGKNTYFVNVFVDGCINFGCCKSQMKKFMQEQTTIGMKAYVQCLPKVRRYLRDDKTLVKEMR